ncbi:MAG TPA: zf-HC2 domain-containing protein [Longimicrobiaceae bacterium]|nr:zf-HC2 domain-containing protein [Longimicrobiaceae bacterium]
MTTHPSEGELQALLDGEVTYVDQEALLRHLRSCDGCRGELEELRRAFDQAIAALVVLDRPAPVREAHRRLVRRRSRGTWGAALRRAAVLLFLASTAVSAALPGSPLREWLATNGWENRPEGEEARRTVGAPTVLQPVPATAPSPTAVSVRPADGRMRVVLVRPSPGLRVRVLVADQERVRVSAEGGSSSPRFRTSADRIEVVDGDPGEVRVTVPRGILHFVLEAGGRRYVSKEGDRLHLSGTGPDRSGPELVFKVQP